MPNVMICARSKEAADAIHASAVQAGIGPIDQTRKRSLDGDTPLHILYFAASMSALGFVKSALLELVKQRKIEYVKIGDVEIRNATVSEIERVFATKPDADP
ncbi:hypothetical protein BH10PSE12_BH10PSE12_08040 [soil metagenome]